MMLTRLNKWLDENVFYKKNKRNGFIRSVEEHRFYCKASRLTGEQPKLGKISSLCRDIKKWYRRKTMLRYDKRFIQQMKRGVMKAVATAGCVAAVTIVLFAAGAGERLLAFVEGIEYFHLSHISITGAKRVERAELKELAGLDFSRSLLGIDTEELESKLEKHDWIKRATVTRKWPDVLQLEIEEFEPYALVSLGESPEQQLFYIDEKGVVFHSIDDEHDRDLPVITGLGSKDELKDKKKLVKEIFQFLKRVKRNNPRLPARSVSEIHVTDDDQLVVFLVEYPFPIFFGRGDVRDKYSMLLRILGKLKKKQGRESMITKIGSIHMDYQKNKVLVLKN